MGGLLIGNHRLIYVAWTAAGCTTATRSPKIASRLRCVLRGTDAGFLSVAGYYAARSRPPSARSVTDAALAEPIRQALACHLRGRELAHELGDLHLEGLCLINIANTYRLTGRYDDSIGHYAQALDICRQFGNQRGEAFTLLGLGACLRAAGRRDRARAHLRDALTLFEQLGMADDVTETKDVLAAT